MKELQNPSNREDSGYSSDSGWRLKLPSPDAFFSQYFRTQASQLLPAAGSRPVKARAAISAYAIFCRSLESFGKRRTKDTASVGPDTRSKMYPSIFLPSFVVSVTSPR